MRKRVALIVAAIMALSLLGSPAAAGSEHICMVKVPGFGCMERLVCKTANKALPEKVQCLH